MPTACWLAAIKEITMIARAIRKKTTAAKADKK